MLESDLKLLVVFVLLVASILLRVSVESTGYTSPDSEYYLEAAQNILNGTGFHHSTEYPIPEVKTPENQTFFAVWPLGYPVLIAGFACIFSLPVFWASKLVNIFFLGLCLLLFRRMNRHYSYLLGLSLCAFTFLEVFSYTWSEAPFLVILLWFGYALHKFLSGTNINKPVIHLFISSLLLFLLRYIGAFSFIILGSVGLYFLIKNKIKQAALLLLLTFLVGSIAALYLYNNYLHTGYLTGGARLFPNQESLSLFFWYLFVGLFNEFFVIRNYYWRGENPDTLFLITASIQILLMLYLYLRYFKGNVAPSVGNDKLSFLYNTIGCTYLFVLIILRFLSPFDPFDYRLLAPFTICMYVAGILFLVNPVRLSHVKGSLNYILAFFIFSLLLNLPKVYIISKLKILLTYL